MNKLYQNAINKYTENIKEINGNAIIYARENIIYLHLDPEKEDIEIKKRHCDYVVKHLFVHKGKLYDAGDYGVYETMTDELIIDGGRNYPITAINSIEENLAKRILQKNIDELQNGREMIEGLLNSPLNQKM